MAGSVASSLDGPWQVVGVECVQDLKRGKRKRVFQAYSVFWVLEVVVL